MKFLGLPLSSLRVFFPSASFVPCGFLPNPLHQLSVFPTLHSHSIYSVPMVIFAPGLAVCSLASKAPLPIAPHSVLMLLTSCMTSYSPCCRGILHARAWFLVVVSLHGGPTSVTLRASPGMVRGGTIVGIRIPCGTLDPERLVWHSIAQCARPVARIGRNGNLVSHHSLSLSLGFRHPPHFPWPSSFAWRPIRSREVVSSSSLGSFDEDFHAVVSARFLNVCSVCAEGSGLFDAPFSASEVRHALTLCSR